LGFNLIAEPWVPVVQAGRYREASPLEALSTPGLVLAAHPYEEAPVLRFLLYLLAWAFQGEDEEEVAELPPEAWRERAEERTRPFLEAFDLFGEGFFLRGEGEVPWEGLEVLRPDWPSKGGEPAYLARPRGVPGPLRLAPAETARALLASLAYSPGGLYKRLGLTSLPGAPLSQGAVFYALGRDLPTTLALNLVVPGRLTAPWEEGYRPREPLDLYLFPSRRYALRLGEDGLVDAVRVYPGLPPLREAPDPMMAHGERRGSPVPLTPREGEDLFGAVLPRFRERRPPLVLERAAYREEVLGPYAVRVVAQVKDQSRIPALLEATFPAMNLEREGFRLRLAETAWELGEVLAEASREAGGGKGAPSGFLFGAERAVLEAGSEEEGRRTLKALFARSLEEALAPKAAKRPKAVAEAYRRAWRKAAKILEVGT